MRGLWLFRRYPQFVDRGEQLFRRHGLKSVFIARFVGADAAARLLGSPERRAFVDSVGSLLALADFSFDAATSRCSSVTGTAPPGAPQVCALA